MEHKLTWNLVGQTIKAHSNTFHDQGSLMDYSLESNGDDTWVAHLDGWPIFTGPLVQAIEACERSDVEAKP
jgi:hypothetical protein